MTGKKFTFSMTLGMAAIIAVLSMALLCGSTSAAIPQAQQQAQQPSVAKQAGVIKAISGHTITLTPDSGGDLSVIVQDNTKIVRVAPGQTDLKSATPIQLPDLQVGDRVFVRGVASADAKSMTAAGIIVMKRSDVDAKQQQDRDDWQKRGIGGMVESVDPAAGAITISVVSLSGKKSLVIHTTNKTILRRYAPGSVKFDDAKPAPLDRIQQGDQLRARGTRNADGTEFAAEEIVSGSFRNIAGTIESVDSAAGTITVQDLIAKAPVLVKISDQSQIRKLSPMVAQGIALRMKRAADASAGGAPGAASKAGTAPAGTPPGAGDSGASHAQAGGTPGSSHSGAGQFDFQQILSRMPASKLSDLQKGDVVMIVATSGLASSQVTAITVLGGVEQILAAAPSGVRTMTLSPWSLGGEPAGAGADSNP